MNQDCLYQTGMGVEASKREQLSQEIYHGELEEVFLLLHWPENQLLRGLVLGNVGDLCYTKSKPGSIPTLRYCCRTRLRIKCRMWLLAFWVLNMQCVRQLKQSSQITTDQWIKQAHVSHSLRDSFSLKSPLLLTVLVLSTL